MNFSLLFFQSSQISSLKLYAIFVSFLFSNLLLTTEAMGILRFAGVFTVALRQGECGRKTSEMHVSQPMNIGVC